MSEKRAREFRVALWWRWEGENVRCLLCSRQCLIPPGKCGFCGVRKHVFPHGLVSLVYARPLALAVDPVEKKPLYHFFPGAQVLSLGTAGCTMDCPYCQNHDLVSASFLGDAEELSPEDLVRLAEKKGLSLLAFTYNEPTVWFEYILDCARIWKDRGGHTILVTNGQMAEEPLCELVPWIAAANVDVKAFEETVYRDVLGGSLSQSLAFVEKLAAEGVHVEVTWLVVPGVNTGEKPFRAFVEWLEGVSPFIPLHITRAFPAYRWRGEPPSMEIMEYFKEEAAKKLHYVYMGNVGFLESTQCYQCKNDILIRPCYNASGLETSKERKCPFCGAPTHIIR